MQPSKTTAFCLALAASAFLAGRATSTTTLQDEAQIRELMDELGKPGKHHELLDAFTGTWKAEASFWMSPEGPPMQSSGVMKNAWILDGRYLKQDYEGEFLAERFKGIGIWGYDNAGKAYQSLWIDSMSTAISFTDGGEVSADGKTFTSRFEEKDPMTGQLEKMRDVVTILGPDEHVFTRYQAGPGGEYKSMEIVYTRQ